jgi:hypothetical protein
MFGVFLSSTFQDFGDYRNEVSAALEEDADARATRLENAAGPYEPAVAMCREVLRLRMREKPSAVVCAAACGADLLLLDVAGKMHIQQIVLLPSDPETFRKGSVTDRPGDWVTFMTAC